MKGAETDKIDEMVCYSDFDPTYRSVELRFGP